MKQLPLLFFILLAIPIFSQQKPPIIDMHLHASQIGGLPPKEPLTGLLAPESNKELRAKTLGALERHNIILAVTSGALVGLYKDSAPAQIIKGCGFMGLKI